VVQSIVDQRFFGSANRLLQAFNVGVFEADLHHRQNSAADVDLHVFLRDPWLLELRIEIFFIFVVVFVIFKSGLLVLRFIRIFQVAEV